MSNFNVFKGLVINIFGSVFLKLSGFFLSVYLARNFTQEEFGYYALTIAGLVFFANSFAGVIPAYVASKIGDDRSVVFKLYIIIFLYCMFLWGLVFLSLLDLWIGILAPFLILYSPMIGMLNYQGRYSILGFSTLLSMLGFIVALTLNIFYEGGVMSYTVVYILPYLILFLLLTFYCFDCGKELGDYNIVGIVRDIKSLLLLLLGAALVPASYWLLYKQVLEYSGASAVAEIASIFQWLFVSSQLSIVAANVLVPRIKKKSLLLLNVYVVWVPVQIFSTILMLFPEIHIMLFGELYDSIDVRKSIVLLMVVAVVGASKSSIYRNILSTGKYWISIVSNFAYLMILITVVYLVRPSDIVGFMVIYAVTNLVVFFIMFPVYVKFDVANVYQFFGPPSLVLWGGGVLAGVTSYMLLESYFLRGIILFFCIATIFLSVLYSYRMGHER